MARPMKKQDYSKMSRQELLEESIRAFTEAISIKPDYYEAYRNRAEARVNAGYYKQATEDIEKALSLLDKTLSTQRKRSECYYISAMAYYRWFEDQSSGKEKYLDQAIDNIEQSIKLAENDGGDLRNILADMCMKKARLVSGNEEEKYLKMAIHNFEKANKMREQMSKS